MLKIEPIYREIGIRLTEARRAAGLTPVALSKSVGGAPSRTSIANIEAGRQRVLIHDLFRLADALGVPVETLLGLGDRGRGTESVLLASGVPDDVARLIARDQRSR